MTMSEGANRPVLSEPSREFFAAIAKTCAPRIDLASVPILGIQRDRICHGRTGVLYRIAGNHFVLTASHELQRTVEANIPLYLSMNKAGVMPLPLADAKFCSTEEEGVKKGDITDFGASATTLGVFIGERQPQISDVTFSSP